MRGVLIKNVLYICFYFLSRPTTPPRSRLQRPLQCLLTFQAITCVQIRVKLHHLKDLFSIFIDIFIIFQMNLHFLSYFDTLKSIHLKSHWILWKKIKRTFTNYKISIPKNPKHVSNLVTETVEYRNYK